MARIPWYFDFLCNSLLSVCLICYVSIHWSCLYYDILLIGIFLNSFPPLCRTCFLGDVFFKIPNVLTLFVLFSVACICVSGWLTIPKCMQNHAVRQRHWDSGTHTVLLSRTWIDIQSLITFTNRFSFYIVSKFSEDIKLNLYKLPLPLWVVFILDVCLSSCLFSDNIWTTRIY